MASSLCPETIYLLQIPKIKFTSSDLYMIMIIGDGSCFFHAVLRGFNKDYIRARDVNERKKLAKKLRKAIAETLDETDENGISEYDKLGGGNYSEYSKAIAPVCGDKYSLQALKKELLSDAWVDHAYIQMLSDHIGIDIYLINGISGDIYTTGTDIKLIYKHRNSIVLIYSNNHYNIVGIRRIANEDIPNIQNKGDTVFDCLFEPEHELIRCLQRRLNALIKE